jgi:uncharacterized repeat protein (TIGR01451 family)
MKNVAPYIFILLFLSSFINAQEVNFLWANSHGGTTWDVGNDVITDSSGNVYITGYFHGTTDFDPGPNIENRTAQNSDIFIQKLSPEGSLIWIKTIGGSANEEANSIALDPFGNIYVTGSLGSPNVDFDPGVGVFNISTKGGLDVFILKLDSNGDFLWAKAVGAANSTDQIGYQVVADYWGNVYVTGMFWSTVDFDPGVNVFQISEQNSPFGGSDAFLLKLNNNGTFMWAKGLGSTFFDEGLSVAIGTWGNVLIGGQFSATADFDPSSAVYNVTSLGGDDVFVANLDWNGNFVWVKTFGGPNFDYLKDIKTDLTGNIYLAGSYFGTADFDPDTSIYQMSTAGSYDAYVLKLNPLGEFIWAKSMGGTQNDRAHSLALDQYNNIYTTGFHFSPIGDFNPNNEVYNLYGSGYSDIYLHKLDKNGAFIWAKSIGNTNYDYGQGIDVDLEGNVLLTGMFEGTVDFDFNGGVQELTGLGGKQIFIAKYNQNGIYGKIYQDFNGNCTEDSLDVLLTNRNVLITPGNIVTESDIDGYWAVDSLAIGNYTATVDVSGTWTSNCPISQNFTVTNPDSIIKGPSFGLYSTHPCPKPTVSIIAPTLRPGFSNQGVYLEVCNQINGTGTLDSIFVRVILDTLLTPQSFSHPYTLIGVNQYEIYLGDIYPTECVQVTIHCDLSINAILNQSLCMEASIYPVDTCYLNRLTTSLPSNSCNSPFDLSHLLIRPTCDNDTISFVITNTGDGDMDCYSHVRLYIDGLLVEIDSVFLMSGDTAQFNYLGDGRTWRLEVDQHPLHPGNSNPSSTIELCGSGNNWTPNLFNILPHDDADPYKDIYCGLVTGSFDPNDKTGYPSGLGQNNTIAPGQGLKYLIRFQNTGTDTAFTVKIRDTLSTDMNILTVQSKGASHPYDFKMHGPRILEWTFNNIMLPDSNTNEAASHGFIIFDVEQAPNLPLGTQITNSAAIYFDFNAPIITNITSHTINLLQQSISSKKDLPKEDLVLIYPNPTEDILYIQQELLGDIDVSIYNSYGTLVLNKALNSNFVELSLKDLPSGFYVIQIKNLGKQFVQKIIKI